MSYFDDASLVMIPSGYKTSKVYSVKPTSGDGDLTFTRSNDTATRVNSAGLIEKVRTNICLYSEQFDNAWWVKGAFVGGTAPTITSNYGEAPNGTTTADRVQFPSQSGSEVSSLQTPNSFAGVNFIGSIYVRTISGTCSNLVIRAGATESVVPSFSTTWTRITAIPSTNPADEGLQIRNRPSVSGDGSAIDILVWGAQLETGDIATDYIETTTAAVSVGPVANVPRLDYLGSTCGKLILEPQRTNLFQYSEQLDNAYWSKIGSLTITANNAVSPDGTTNADLVTKIDGSVRIQRAFTGLTAGTRTLSCFVKAGTGTTFTINAYDGIVDKGAGYNLVTGAVLFTSAGVSATITDYGNGWYRLTHTYTSAGTSYSCQFYLDNVGTYQVWGMQFENAADYATSYIPTLGAAVTRGADVCNKTSISSLIGQTEGTIFVEFNRSQDKGGAKDFFIASLSAAGSSSNRIYLVLRSSTEASFPKSLELGMVNGGVLQFSYLGTTVNAGTHKIALAYKANDLAVYFDGVQIATDTSCTIPATDKFTLGIRENDNTATTFDDTFAQALLFKTRLPNSSLAELTA